MTRNREAILEVIRESPGPVSAAEVWDRLRARGSRIGIATVYRILKGETEAGTLEHSEFPGGQSRYETAGRDHHHHFLCTNCDRAFEVSGCVDGIQAIVPPRFALAGHAIMLFGECLDCQEVG